jgi:hypothetical protein
MYVHSATSHGAAGNDDALLILGYPQRTIYENISAAGITSLKKIIISFKSNGELRSSC